MKRALIALAAVFALALSTQQASAQVVYYSYPTYTYSSPYYGGYYSSYRYPYSTYYHSPYTRNYTPYWSGGGWDTRGWSGTTWGTTNWGRPGWGTGFGTGSRFWVPTPRISIGW